MAKRRGRGEGSIEELPSGKWRAVLSLGSKPDGGRNKMSKTFTAKQQAIAWLRERQQEQSAGTLARAGKMTVGEWLATWLETMRGKVEPGTWESYRKPANSHLTPILGGIILAKLTPLDVEGLYVAMRAKGASADAQRKAGKILRTALKSAMSHGLVARNVATVVTRPKADASTIRPFDRDQAVRFLVACKGERLAAIFYLALDSGARSGEMRGLHWPEVHLDLGSVRITQSLDEAGDVPILKTPKTSQSRRTIPLTTQTVERLRAHRLAMEGEGRDVIYGPVFPNRAGNWLLSGNLHKTFSRIVHRAGVPRVRVHDLRHTMATLLLLAGVNAKIVSERLGHRSVTITLDTYSHVLPAMQEMAVAALSEALRVTVT